MKYIIYLRRSSDDNRRQVYSIEDQKKVLGEIVKRLNLDVVETISESFSAKAPGRPEFNRMVQKIHDGHANGIIVWEMDRLARNPVDAGSLAYILQNKVIREIRTPYNTYDFNTDSTVLMLSFGIATDFVRKLSRNVCRGLQSRLEAGFFPGNPPIGYQTKGKGIIIPDEKAHYIRECFQRYDTGEFSIRSLCKYMAEAGFLSRSHKPINKGAIEIILNNPIYSGLIRWAHRAGGESLYNGQHEPLISHSLFERVQKRLHGKNQSGDSKRNFLFKSKVRCGCGYTLKTYETKNHKYLDCNRKCGFLIENKKRKTIPENFMVEYVTQIFEKMIVPEKYQEDIKKEFRALNSQITEQNHKTIAAFQNKLNGIERKLANNREDRNNRDITIEDYQANRTKYTKERKKISEQMEQVISERENAFDDTLEDFLFIGLLLKNNFKNLSLTNQRRVIELLFEDIVFAYDKVKIKYTEMGQWLLWPACNNLSIELSETANTHKKSPCGAFLDKWWRVQGRIRTFFYQNNNTIFEIKNLLIAVNKQ